LANHPITPARREFLLFAAEQDGLLRRLAIPLPGGTITWYAGLYGRERKMPDAGGIALYKGGFTSPIRAPRSVNTLRFGRSYFLYKLSISSYDYLDKPPPFQPPEQALHASTSSDPRLFKLWLAPRWKAHATDLDQPDEEQRRTGLAETVSMTIDERTIDVRCGCDTVVIPCVSESVKAPRLEPLQNSF
jgi:hypothetical protein